MAIFSTYVLVSRSTQETYVGQTEDLARRLLEDNDPLNRRSFSHQAAAWPVAACLFRDVRFPR
jgi:predicted GIY-YIG superfamily endonuclease